MFFGGREGGIENKLVFPDIKIFRQIPSRAKKIISSRQKQYDINMIIGPKAKQVQHFLNNYLQSLVALFSKDWGFEILQNFVIFCHINKVHNHGLSGATVVAVTPSENKLTSESRRLHMSW